MNQPRYRRRKEERPEQITAAAFDAFAERGFEATKVEDVARRAGISKGLMYLYFKTKEELFKAVVKSFFKPKIELLEQSLSKNNQSVEAFIRGPMLDLMKEVPGSKIGAVMRLMISEGPKHPDLVDYFWDEVTSRGIKALTHALERGVEQGEFKRTAVNELPHLLVMPVIFSVFFRILFGSNRLDTDHLIETHIDLLLNYIKVDKEASA